MIKENAGINLVTVERFVNCILFLPMHSAFYSLHTLNHIAGYGPCWCWVLFYTYCSTLQ